MSNMTRRIRNASAATLLVGACAAGPVVNALASAPQDVPATCTATVVAFEDGTWMGAAVYDAAGVQVAERWDVVTPERLGVTTDAAGVRTLHTSYPAQWGWQNCTMILSGNA